MEHGKCRGKDITTHMLCCEAMVYRYYIQFAERHLEHCWASVH